MNIFSLVRGSNSHRPERRRPHILYEPHRGQCFLTADRPQSQTSPLPSIMRPGAGIGIDRLPFYLSRIAILYCRKRERTQSSTIIALESATYEKCALFFFKSVRHDVLCKRTAHSNWGAKYLPKTIMYPKARYIYPYIIKIYIINTQYCLPPVASSVMSCWCSMSIPGSDNDRLTTKQNRGYCVIITQDNMRARYVSLEKVKECAIRMSFAMKDIPITHSHSLFLLCMRCQELGKPCIRLSLVPSACCAYTKVRAIVGTVHCIPRRRYILRYHAR